LIVISSFTIDPPRKARQVNLVGFSDISVILRKPLFGLLMDQFDLLSLPNSFGTLEIR
jgi:hypothetical protein